MDTKCRHTHGYTFLTETATHHEVPGRLTETLVVTWAGAQITGVR